jgi:hypothetical protein
VANEVTSEEFLSVFIISMAELGHSFLEVAPPTEAEMRERLESARCRRCGEQRARLAEPVTV